MRKWEFLTVWMCVIVKFDFTSFFVSGLLVADFCANIFFFQFYIPVGYSFLNFIYSTWIWPSVISVWAKRTFKMFGGQQIEDFNFEYSASISGFSLSMKIKTEIFEYNYTKYFYEFCLNLIGEKKDRTWTKYYNPS